VLSVDTTSAKRGTPLSDDWGSATIVRMPLPFDPIEEAATNWQAKGWDAVPGMQAITSISRANQIINARINEALAPLDLNLSRFELLALLYMSRARSLPMGKIGERLQVHPASVTNTVDRLEGDGLVRRVPHETDRRTTLAELTPEGVQVIEDAQKVMAAINYGIDGVGDAALRRITRDLGVLRKSTGDFE